MIGEGKVNINHSTPPEVLPQTNVRLTLGL